MIEVSNDIDDSSFSINDPIDNIDNNKIVIFENETIIIENNDIFKNSKLKFQFISSMITLFYIGLSDQVIGSLIEYIMNNYKINRAQISYLFLFQCFGYIPSCILNNYLMYKFGLNKLYSISCLIVTLTSFLFYLKSPFPILIICAIFNGFSLSTFDCCLHYFIGNLKYSNELLGIMHAMYGVGCLITPVLSNHLINIGINWNNYYLLLSITGFINFFFAYFLFKNETNLKYRYSISNQNSINNSIISNDVPSTWEIITNKYVFYYAFILFIYVGGELCIGVWLNNYLFRIKNQTTEKSSLITSTYWLFMTLGRFFMGFFTGRYFQDLEIKATILYCLLVTLCCLIFWIFQNSLILQSISIFIAGWFVGPIFSTTIVVALKTLPKKISLNSISIIASFAGAGAAVIPSIFGYIAEYGSKNSSQGAGLKYFPQMIFIMFFLASVFWLAFYVSKRKILDSKLRL